MYFYKTGNFKAIKSLLRTFFQVATYPSVCSNLPRCEKSWNILNFKIIKWQFCSNVCLVRISVSRKSKVNLGLRPRTGNAKNYRVVSKIEIFGPTNPHLVKDVITKTSNIWLAFVL